MGMNNYFNMNYLKIPSHNFKKYYIMKFDVIISSLIIIIILHLCTIIHLSEAARGKLGDYCESFRDCDQTKFLTCIKHRSTCDCADRSTFSGKKQICVFHIGESCNLPNIEHKLGPLPIAHCVENAKCVRDPSSKLAFNVGTCVCEDGFYRTIDNYCFKNPASSESIDNFNNFNNAKPNANNNKYPSPSLNNVLSSINDKSSSGDGKSSSAGPPPYHHPLTRSAGSKIFKNSCIYIVIITSLVLSLLASINL